MNLHSGDFRGCFIVEKPATFVLKQFDDPMS